MELKRSPSSLPTKVFTEAEYRADARSVIAHAEATGSAIVAREDGTPRFMIAIPPPEATDSTD